MGDAAPLQRRSSSKTGGEHEKTAAVSLTEREPPAIVHHVSRALGRWEQACCLTDLSRFALLSSSILSPVKPASKSGAGCIFEMLAYRHRDLQRTALLFPSPCCQHLKSARQQSMAGWPPKQRWKDQSPEEAWGRGIKVVLN